MRWAPPLPPVPLPPTPLAHAARAPEPPSLLPGTAASAPRSGCPALPLALAALAALAGCSLSTYEYTPCETHAECRDAFGFGHVCDEAGLCAAVEPDPRCTETFPVDLFDRPENYADAIVLGTLFDHVDDVPETLAAQLAVMQVNDSAGLDGRPFAIVQCSYAVDYALDALESDAATTRTTAFLAETLGVPAIVGPATSSTAELAYAVAGPAGTVLISPSATSPSLTTIDGTVKTDEAPGLFWRTAPPDSLQGEAVAFDMIHRLVDDVAVIALEGSYGEGLADVFEAAFTPGGGRVTRHVFADNTERDLAANAVKSARPDEVLFISSEPSDIVAFLNTVTAYEEYADIGIFLTDTARDQQVLEDAAFASALFDQVRGTAPSVPDGDVYDFFAGAYNGAFAPETAAASVYTAHTWDAAWLAFYGVAWSAANEGGISGLGVARGLRHVSAGDPWAINPTSWEPVLAAFADGAPVDVLGASGLLDYDPVTEETTASIEVWFVEAGAFRTAYTYP